MALNENDSQGCLNEGHKTISSSGFLIDVIDMINNHNLNKGIYKDMFIQKSMSFHSGVTSGLLKEQ